MKTEVLAQILVKSGIIPAAAVEDPEGYDNWNTVGCIGEAAVLIAAEVAKDEMGRAKGST